MKTKSEKVVGKKPAKRSRCPIAGALDIIGDKWSLLIVRDIKFFNKCRYDDFLASPEKISTNILADRLRKLEEYGIVAKQQYGTHSQRMSYELTTRGESLAKILIELKNWGLENIPNTASLKP